MVLSEYNSKRDFSITKEPRGKAGGKGQRRFVIQEHHASHLHYDFRLEDKSEEGDEIVLVSWAIPKNIPLQAGVKHLAVQTEDHPVDYIDFEGEIPEGEYGAGTVKVWDTGNWKNLKGGVGEGSLHFELLGKKAKGEYVMIRTKGFGKKAPEKGPGSNWLVWRKN